jgi:DNA (cytosine-5)-methyltransferase 1
VKPMEFSRAASGLLLPKQITVHRRPLAIDLFCGCGGFSLGMMQGGFEVIAAADHDPVAAQTYLMNLGDYPVDLHFVEPKDKNKLEKLLERQTKQSEGLTVIPVSGKHRNPELPGVKHFWLGDITKVKGQDILDAVGLSIGEIDCVFGGPPCQGFSKAGKQDVLDPRNSLIFEFARLILEIRPKSMVMENVPGILSMVTPEGIPVIDAFCRILSDGGFSSYDALVKSLKAQQGSWGTVRNSPRSQRKEKQTSTNGQMSLFEEVQS